MDVFDGPSSRLEHAVFSAGVGVLHRLGVEEEIYLMLAWIVLACLHFIKQKRRRSLPLSLLGIQPACSA